MIRAFFVLYGRPGFQRALTILGLALLCVGVGLGGLAPAANAADPVDPAAESTTGIEPPSENGADPAGTDPQRPGLHQAVESLLALTTIVIAAVAGGIGLGAFGLLAHRIFRRRARMTDRILRTRPGLSLATGIAISIAALAMLSIVAGTEGLPVLVLFAYGSGLAMFAASAAVRLAADTVEATPTLDEPMTARAAVSGGLLLVFMNALLVLGSVLFFGILLAGVGAALLSYFASVRVAAASVVQDEPDAMRPES